MQLILNNAKQWGYVVMCQIFDPALRRQGRSLRQVILPKQCNK